MRPIDSGVIGLVHPVAPGTEASGTDAVHAMAPGALPALPLGAFPADIPDPEAPAFALSRKEFEQEGTPLSGGLPHFPGGDTHAASVLDGALSPALDSAHGVLSGAQQSLSDAQGMVGSAQAALNNVPAAVNAAQAAFNQAAGNPVLPPLPADPVGDLMKGLSVPAIPGIDALFKPFLDLINSFGTGVLGSLNPATLLSQSSKYIESAVQIGSGALKTVEQLWQGQASNKAQAAGQQAQQHGEETTQRGFDLSTLTEQAAAVVQRGNIQLTAIAQSFATQATMLAPVALTPPGQTALIASATEHLGSAITVVNLTHGELSGYTAQLNALIAQLVGQNGGGVNPAEVAQSLAQNVGQPILEQAKSLLEGAMNPSAANPGGPGTPGSATDLDTKAAGLGGGGGGGGTGGGAGGGAGLGGGIPSVPGGPGSSIPGGRIAAQANPFGSGIPGAPGMGGPGSPGFMGSPGAAGAGRGGGSDQEYSRTVQPHQSVSAESELTGNLGAAGPGVIGQPDDEPTGDHDTDQA
ncbi:hypothetical protein OHB26_25865 [Nocardia sp. NBC_01503]|uniref:hypothetical protein n=1 Tax=Nocardia sp. NBC_01503 TaxID=2975997 RepID=UPI002E7B4AAE|nr:hypothetical protein [Nocardia sp. NBC_01503]WTL30355.1 hypothetical protein OHB26_25865 [Nocardia sp. NBC_01503]